MSIVNGNYVSDSLPGAKEVQAQVFGKYQGRNDMADYSAAAYNYLMQQQANAFNLEMWNMKNQYDSPASQMKRYQDAGLNPFLIYGQSNLSGSTPNAPASSFRSAGAFSRGMQQGISAVNSMINSVRAAREIYDFARFGLTQQSFRTSLLGAQAEGQFLANRWNSYLIGEEGSGVSPTSPRATMYRYQSETQEQRIEQLKAIIKTIPDQNERTKALKALDDYRLEILHGQNDAILNINTGNSTVDGVLRLLGYWLIAQ